MKTKQLQAPTIPSDLLEWLDKVFPERCARLEQTDREVWIEAGARTVVRRLIVEKERQEQDKVKR